MVKIDVYVHHRGFFARPPDGTVTYVGGVVDNLVEDTETMAFSDLEHYAVAFDYYRRNSIVYYQCDGHSFEKDVRILYDDSCIKEMIGICKPYGSIHLYVDHFDLEELETEKAITKEKENNECSDGSSADDPDFVEDYEDEGTDTEVELESEGEVEFEEDGSDDELLENVKGMKMRKAAEANKVNAALRKSMVKEGDDESGDSAYLSDELRSVASSSEDEPVRKGYIGPPPTNKKRKKEEFSV